MSNYRDDFRKSQREYYWSLPRVFAATAVGLTGLCAIGFGLNYAAYGNFAIFAPKYESTRRDVMIESRAYSEAITREMYRLKLQYQQAKTEDEKHTIRAMIVHETSAFDKTRLPNDLRMFITQLGI